MYPTISDDELAVQDKATDGAVVVPVPDTATDGAVVELLAIVIVALAALDEVGVNVMLSAAD